MQLLDDAEPVGDLGVSLGQSVHTDAPLPLKYLPVEYQAGLSDQTRADYKVDHLKRAASVTTHVAVNYTQRSPAAQATHADGSAIPISEYLPVHRPASIRRQTRADSLSGTALPALCCR